MDPSRADSRYNLNYSMSSIGLSLADQADMYGNPAAVASLGARPPSGGGGLIQTMGGVASGTGVGGGYSARGGSLMPNTTQCQSLINSSANSSVGPVQQQQRGIKRAGSDCYEDHHRGNNSGLTPQSLQGLESCRAGGNGQHVSQQQQSTANVSDIVDDSYNALHNKKSPPANGKKTKGRVKIKMEYIDNKLRRYTTFSKRKTGIMKKAYELSTLTGTQVMLLVASETGHVYTFATRKLQPMITSEAGKQLIQTCLNSPDPPSVGGGDQRMSATGFEETELSYNIADEDSKDDRSPLSSINESDDSSDIDSPAAAIVNCKNALTHNDGRLTLTENTPVVANSCSTHKKKFEEPTSSLPDESEEKMYNKTITSLTESASKARCDNLMISNTALSSIPQEVLLQLIQSGHLQLHTEEDGSGHQYVAIPLSSSSAVNLMAASRKDITSESKELNHVAEKTEKSITIEKDTSLKNLSSSTMPMMTIKEEFD